MGHGLRQKRLENELLEFGFRYHLSKGRAATLEELVCIGNFLMDSHGGYLPTEPMPVDEELFVNRHTIRMLMHWLEERSGGALRETL